MQAYRNCPRFRFLHYHYGGTGLERISMALPLVTGIAVHEALAEVLLGADPTAAIDRAFAQYEMDVLERGITDEVLSPRFFAEQRALLAGLVYAWHRVRYPQLLREYEPVLIERELLWPLGSRNGVNVLDMIRADALVRRRADGLLFYLEFKTTTKGDENWVRSWEHNSQILINTVAIEELLGERLGGVLIEGLLKGSRRKCTLKTSPFYGEVIQDSPFCYAFRSMGPKGVVYHTAWERGAEHIRVWEKMPSTQAWIQQLPEEDLLAQFVALPPIRPSEEQLERHRRQMLIQEEQVAWGLDELSRSSDPAVHRHILDAVFPQNDDHCYRYYGSPCSMEPVCFTRAVALDPLGSGLYVARTPHHVSEGTGVVAAQDKGPAARDGGAAGTGN